MSAADRRRPLPGPALLSGPLLAAVLLLSACSAPEDAPGPASGSSGSSPTASAVEEQDEDGSSAGATAAPSVPAASSGSSRPGSAPAASGGSALRDCDPVDLDLALGGTDSGAGSIDRTIVLANRGRVACSISGAPVVHMVDADVQPLGPDATGSGAPTPVLRLPVGGSLSAVVRIVNVGEDGGPLGDRCTPATGAALIVETADRRRGDPLEGAFRGCREPDVATMAVTPWRLDG
ncbi:DUF4232 domain-containing protein [Amnibacterium endophyticum]|uniref:DUF4232 domain-containing protein n=1 Tax=Amnibacterium endophyticum TaxID=2109337 RepID=A0ABW4LD76_9MICO